MFQNKKTLRNKNIKEHVFIEKQKKT